MQVGDFAEATLTVQDGDTAQAVAISREDAFPAVFATSRMIALMEVAAARAVEHRAATPVGGHVRAVATYLRPEGKLYRFQVEAFDDAGPIGGGEHTRAIVATERLIAGAAKRKP